MGWLKNVLCGVKWFLGYEEEETGTPSLTATASPFTTSKPSRQYIDEDGDIAEEFFEEVTPLSGQPWMKQITNNLVWRGIVKLDLPRLHYDFPIIMYQS